MTHRWRSVSDDYDLVYLPIDEPVLQSLESKGWRRGTPAQIFFRGLEADLPTVDFSGWYMFCRKSLDDEAASLTIRAIDEQQHVINASFEPFEGLISKIDMAQLCANLPVPLHPGAAQYYREKGYLA